MIIIFTISRDQASNEVVHWLRYFGHEVLRLNEDDPGGPPIEFCLDQSGFSLEVGGRRITADQIEAVWYRKGGIWLPEAEDSIDIPGRKALSKLLDRRRELERKCAGEFFYWHLKQAGIRILGNPLMTTPNKLVTFGKASNLGLTTPGLMVTNSSRAVRCLDGDSYVTKALTDGVYLWDAEGAGEGYFSYTELLSSINIGDDDFLPTSLVQKKIEKIYEVRVFFLDGAFTTFAIYSQADPQTSIDMRKYNVSKPNRIELIELPENVCEKLGSLFEELDLNTGSVDMIVNSDGDYVFLEINPVGIYSNLNEACNTSIDENIARWLIGSISNEAS